MTLPSALLTYGASLRQHARLTCVFAAESTLRSRRPGAPTSASCPPTDTLTAAAGKTELTAVIKTISHGVPDGLPLAESPIVSPPGVGIHADSRRAKPL